MPYDALGNYIPGDDEPSIDQMRLALTHKQPPAYTQIPTHGYPQAPQAQRPLDHVPKTFRDIATNFNPLMLMKSIQEGVGSTMVNPVVGGLQGVATELQSPEFWDTSRTKPTGIAEKVATDFMQRNAPTTPLAQQFTEGIGELTKDLPAYLGHLQTGRPALTPNDIRVMGAEATRVGRQIRDIPSDFANAQAGVQRIDPVTGQPTMGSKLQAGAESIGDLIERRRMQGLMPVPGLPETLQPETSMYAMRPSGSRIAMPVVPSTKDVADVPRNAAPFKIIQRAIGSDMPPQQPLTPDQIEDAINNERIERDIPIDDFKRWAENRALQIYPDAPSPAAALTAWRNTFSNRGDERAAQHKWFAEFLASPEGQASPLSVLPTPDQVQERHNAAVAWLYGPWLNYVNKHVGTIGDPAVKLASEGLTYLPEASLRDEDSDLDAEALRVLRAKAGMTPSGEVFPALAAKQDELAAAQADLDKWQIRRQAYRDIAAQQGLPDPGMLPEYAATTQPIRELTRNVEKLEEQARNLRLGVAYENLSDWAVTAKSRDEVLGSLDYADQQFYPSVTRARPTDVIYGMPSSVKLERLGLGDLAKDVYADVMSGKIPVDRLPSLSIDKLIRSKAEPRIKQEKAEAKKALTFVADATKQMGNTMQTYAKPEDYFGNVGVIELSRESGLSAEQMTKILSEATTVLDHCIAQGGDAGSRKPNPFHPQHKQVYIPIYDVITGELNPKASRNVSSYASNIIDRGDRIADIRDKNTGLPIATLELSSSHDNEAGQRMYSIGWASGVRNGEVDPKYRDAIKEYLKSRADVIYSPGSNLERNLEIYDRDAFLRSRNPEQLVRYAGVDARTARTIDITGLPRFVTLDDVKKYVENYASTPQPAEQPVAQSVSQNSINGTALTNDLQAAMSNAVELASTDFSPEVAELVESVLVNQPANRNYELDDNRRVEVARDSLLRLAANLDEWVESSQLARSPAIRDAAGPVSEFVTDLRGIIHALERGNYTVAPQVPAVQAAPQVPAVQAEPQQTPARLVDDFIETVGREEGAQVADRVETIAIQVAQSLGRDLTVGAAIRRDPLRFAQQLRHLAQDEDSELVEMALHRLADEVDEFAAPPEVPAPGGREAQQRVATEYFDDYVQQINDAVGFTEADRFVRVANSIINDMGTGTVARTLEIRPTLFAEELASAAELPDNASIRDALLHMADTIAPPIRDLNEPLPELTFEPDPTHPANVPAFNPQEMAFELFQDTRRGEGRDLDELRTTLQALETGNFDDMRFRALPADQRDRAQRDVAHQIRAIMDDLNVTLPAEPEVRQQQQEIARFQPIPARVSEMTYDQLRNALDPQSQGEVASLHDDIVRSNYTPDEIRRIADMVYNHQMSQWEQFDDTQRAMLYMELLSTANRMDPPTRRGPFRPGGSSAVRGLPLGNLNLRPAVTAEMLRGPDTQPVRNFIQQVGNLPGVTQEGLRTGLMAFEQMDPTRQITKAEFVRELLPSSYDIVDLRGASQDNQHLMDAAQDAFDQDASPVGDALGLKGAQLVAWANAVRTQYNDYDSFPANVKRALAKQGVEDADEYAEAYDIAYRDALETYVANYTGNLADEDGYTYANTQRLVQPSMGDQYGEFGVTHPDQRGTYHHFDLAPQGVIGHFRGTYNPADPIMLNTEHWVPSSQSRNPVKQTFETKPNSYVIEEIQSDAQKTAQQTGHLHQVHGVLFKAAIQKALELGATTVYLPTARIIADTRSEEHYTPNGEYIPLDRVTTKFAPIYDQAIVKEGLKPLLKIPGVTSTVVNGYHEISFTPEAIEYILNGPGQSVPGYARGGSVHGYQDGGSVRYPGFFGARDEAVERSEEMFRSRGQDDPADAARHMLASGYMAQAVGPTVAKGLGWLHEFKEAPIRTAGHALGLSKPRYDYEMDMHNNALGVELAQKAKSRPEFEKLVQDAIKQGTTATTPGRVRLMTPEQASEGRGRLKYANGGTVSQTPSLDAMKYELMMRSK